MIPDCVSACVVLDEARVLEHRQMDVLQFGHELLPRRIGGRRAPRGLVEGCDEVVERCSGVRLSQVPEELSPPAIGEYS